MGSIYSCKLVRENSPHHIYVDKIKIQLNNSTSILKIAHQNYSHITYVWHNCFL